MPQVFHCLDDIWLFCRVFRLAPENQTDITLSDNCSESDAESADFVQYITVELFHCFLLSALILRQLIVLFAKQ